MHENNAYVQILLRWKNGSLNAEWINVHNLLLVITSVMSS